ncbi:MAG: hypothetical protein Q4C96_01675, partial [Planctomycetia bacterium]|nr:hypothetical protein [Planctomycetia bacterium]
SSSSSSSENKNISEEPSVFSEKINQDTLNTEDMQNKVPSGKVTKEENVILGKPLLTSSLLLSAESETEKSVFSKNAFLIISLGLTLFFIFAAGFYLQLHEENAVTPSPEVITEKSSSSDASSPTIPVRKVPDFSNTRVTLAETESFVDSESGNYGNPSEISFSEKEPQFDATLASFTPAAVSSAVGQNISDTFNVNVHHEDYPVFDSETAFLSTSSAVSYEDTDIYAHYSTTDEVPQFTPSQEISTTVSKAPSNFPSAPADFPPMKDVLFRSEMNSQEMPIHGHYGNQVKEMPQKTDVSVPKKLPRPPISARNTLSVEPATQIIGITPPPPVCVPPMETSHAVLFSEQDAYPRTNISAEINFPNTAASVTENIQNYQGGEIPVSEQGPVFNNEW